MSTRASPRRNNSGVSERRTGGVIGDALVDRVPGAVADEEGVVAEVLLEFLRGIRGHAEGTDMDYFGVEKGLGVRLYITDQTLDQMLARRRPSR